MDLLYVLRLVVIALAGLLLYCLVLGALASFIIRGVQRNRPVVAAPEREPQERRGGRWSVPGWVARVRNWAVAVVLLGAPDLAERTSPYVDFAVRRIDWLGLRLAATSWPRRDRLIVDVAHDLASGAAPELAEVYPGDPVALTELLGDLDQPPRRPGTRRGRPAPRRLHPHLRPLGRRRHARAPRPARQDRLAVLTGQVGAARHACSGT